MAQWSLCHCFAKSQSAASLLPLTGSLGARDSSASVSPPIMKGICGKEAEMSFFTLNARYPSGSQHWPSVIRISRLPHLLPHQRSPCRNTPKAGAGVYFCNSLDAERLWEPPPGLVGKSNQTVITQEQSEGKVEHRGRRVPLSRPSARDKGWWRPGARAVAAQMFRDHWLSGARGRNGGGGRGMGALASEARGAMLPG